MTEEEKSNNYQKVNPEDYYGYEERFIKKGGGGSGGGKDQDRKGSKTLRALKKQQRQQAQEKRQREAGSHILEVLEGLHEGNNPRERELILEKYLDWLNRSLRGNIRINRRNIRETRSKSGGPGGQHVNKKETRVTLRHTPTQLQAGSDRSRSQGRNRQQAREQLRQQLQDHIRDWQTYLGGNHPVSRELLEELLAEAL